MKSVYIKKQEQTELGKKRAKNDRYCLNCGININHRGKDVKFCCPACKASYAERLSFIDTKPKIPKRHINNDEVPYSAYTESPVEKFKRKYGA